MSATYADVTGWYSTRPDAAGMYAAYRIADEDVQHFATLAEAQAHAASGRRRLDGTPVGAASVTPWYIRGSEYDRRRRGC